MKKVLLSVLVLTISLFAGKYNIDYSIIENNGWGKPFNRTLVTSTEYDYEAENYPTNHNVTWEHGAVDIVATLNEKVYSIGDGKVVKFYRKTGDTQNMSVVYIKYKTSSNEEFLVIYGHVYAKNSLVEGSTVSKGEYIGNIKRYGTPDHIHFGITTNLGYHGSSFGSSNSGTGVVDPLEYLRSNKTSTIYSGIFDGAGSLVSPNESCWGCDKDEVRLHQHDHTGSTGVFQWLHDSSTCSQIDIFSNKDLGNVIIKTKGWEGGPTQNAIKVNLNAYDKVTIKDNNPWTTLAVTTEKALEDSEASLYAYCKTSSDTFYNANREEVSAELVDVTNDYFWTGSGSLMTQSDNAVPGNYGYTKDWANTFRTKKSLTSFQWYVTDECKEVTISKQGYSTAVPVNGISIKPWQAPFSEWVSSGCTSLPCTLNAPSVNYYYIIKVLTDPDALGDKYLQIKCK